VVGAGQELFRMIRQSRLEWRAELTSAELARVRIGTAATLSVADGSSVTGRVRMVAPTVDPQTRLGIVYVDLDAKAGAASPLKAGMFASGAFDLGSDTALTLPQQAVVVREGFAYVFLLRADHHVAQAKITIGRRSGDRIEVLSGLAPDATVAASGAGFLNDGDVVKVAP
jgi:RND family efflux transporter MFP subunit